MHQASRRDRLGGDVGGCTDGLGLGLAQPADQFVQNGEIADRTHACHTPQRLYRLRLPLAAVPVPAPRASAANASRLVLTRTCSRATRSSVGNRYPSTCLTVAAHRLTAASRRSRATT